jgi:hypothetical protein
MRSPRLLLVLLAFAALLVAAPGGVVAEEETHAADGDHGESGDHDEHDDGDAHGKGDGHGKHSSRLTNEKIPLQLDGFPQRPGFLIELGNPYLGTGRIGKGLKMPGGAIWQPTLIAFGTYRSGLQSFERTDSRVTEWANRLDLFFNLQLSGSERLVVGFRPLDQDGAFTSYIFEPEPEDGDRWREELNADLEVLFFEGDFGEMFPNLDKNDFGRTDVGFALGRQPLLFQEGMLIADVIDGVGITRNTLLPQNTSNFRATLFVGLDNVNRQERGEPVNPEDRDSELYALLTSTDVRRSTIDADVAYVSGGDLTGDMVAGGLSFVQRIGKVNTSFRVLGSAALGGETDFATNGFLGFTEISWTPHYSYDLIYFTVFGALDEFSSAARGPSSGGPLGRAGISFAAVGLGNYGAPLSSQARDVAGGAFGYQKFFGALKRRQLITEIGYRFGTTATEPNAAALTARYQMAFGRRTVLVFDAFGAFDEGLDANSDDTRFGGRFEFVLKF